MATQYVHLPTIIAGILVYVENSTDLPPANSVPVGSIRYVNTPAPGVYFSDGTSWEALAPFSGVVTTVNGFTGAVNLTTTDIPEGTNLYFTNERAQDAVGSALTDTTTIDLTYNDALNQITADIQPNSITNTLINSSAAIVYSKLNLSNSIVNADVNTAAAIAYSKLNLLASIVNADINAAAAIAYSKLNLSNSIVNADIAAAAAISYSKLNLSASIVNADIAAAAAIAYNKLAALTINRALQSDASGFVSVSAVTSTELGFLSGVTSSVQTQIDSKVSKAGDTMTGNLIMDNQKEIRFRETTANGTNYTALKAAASVAADTSITLPAVAATANQIPVADASNILTFTDPTAAIRSTQSISGNVTLADGNRDLICLVDTSAPRSITLPLAANNSGRRFTIKDTTGTEETNNITLIPNGTNQIEGINANKVLSANWGSVILFCDGTKYYVI